MTLELDGDLHHMTSVEASAATTEQAALDFLREYSPKHWEVYERCVVAGEKQRIVAPQLGITQPTLSARLKRAKELLAAHMNGALKAKERTVCPDCGAEVKTKDARFCPRHSAGHRKFAPQRCAVETCGAPFTPNSGRQKYCPCHSGPHQCEHPGGCSNIVKRQGRPFCQEHAAKHRTFSEITCEKCSKKFTPTSSTHRSCETCQPTRTRYQCPGCKEWKSEKIQDICLTCQARERARAFVRDLLRCSRETGSPDGLSRLVLEWMVHDDHTFKSAAEALEWPEKRLHWVVYRRKSIRSTTLNDLATRLGGIRALGFDEGQWKSKLTDVRPKGAPETIKAQWLEGVRRIEDRSPFQKALRVRLVQLGLERNEVARIVGERPNTVTRWLTRGRMKPVQPGLHQVANIARLWVKSDSDLERLETVMRRLCMLIYGRKPSAAGLLIMRKLAQRRLAQLPCTDAWLGGKGVGTATSQLIWEGVARPYIQQRVADRLELSPEERDELFAEAKKPPARGVEVMLLNRKRMRGRRTGTQTTKERTAQARAERYWPIFERYKSRGQNPRSRHNWQRILEEAGGSHHTAVKAHDEWLLSTKMAKASGE